MSQFTSGLIGAAVATITFGAAQLALGNDIAGAQITSTSSATKPVNDVNRSPKSDRMPVPSTDESSTKTVAVRVAELPDTSVLIRIPAVVLRKDTTRPQNIQIKSASSTQSASSRRQVACEAVVSVLTDVAKSLQPGRCVT